MMSAFSNSCREVGDQKEREGEHWTVCQVLSTRATGVGR